MLRITLQNLLAKKLRLVSTAFSVVIAVAFLTGSLVLTDTIGRTFDDLFAEVNEGVDAELRSADTVESDFGDLRGRIDESYLDIALGIDGVAAADGSVAGYAQLVAPDGEPLGNPGQGAPTLGFAWSEVDDLNPLVLLEGSRAPMTPDEVVIDAKSAKDGPFAVGDTVTVLLQGPPQEFTIVGIARFGSADSPLGATMAIFDRTTAQTLLGEPGKFDAVDVVAEEGVSQAVLAARLDGAVPPEIEVITGEALTEETQNDVADALSFFNTFMLIFAAISIFVASFIIYNTFSILVVQRTREMALLRALGARRHQLLVGVVLEAVIIGLLASLVGLVAGIGVAGLLKGLFAASGIAIPAGGTVFTLGTAQVSLLVGVGVTILAALVPSWRASSVAPMAAIRAAGTDESGQSRSRAFIGLAMMSVGVGLVLWALFGDAPQLALVLGSGAALVFMGLAWFGPIIALPFSRIVGWPLGRVRGIPGELARENAMRNPRRTSTTAAALMIGVGLVGAISIFASSAKASIDKIIDDSFVGDLVIDSGTYGFGGLSPALADELNELPEVAAASGVRLGFAEIAGKGRTVFSVDPATMGTIVDVGVTEGRIEDMGDDDLAVHTEFAADKGWEVGDRIPVDFATTGTQEFTLSVLYDRNELTGNFFIGNPAYEANFADVFDFQVYILRSPDATPEEALAAVQTVASGFANADVQDLEQFKQSQSDQIDQVLNLVYLLLVLAIFIALIGIANTLALSILERTRELGLLRAVGMTRSQLRSAIRWESVLISLLGTALGAVVGLFFGWVTVRALDGEGITEFRLPTGQLVVFVVIAVLAGVLAATMPARRAAKLKVLEAIAED